MRTEHDENMIENVVKALMQALSEFDCSETD